MRRIHLRICAIGPFARHTQCAPSRHGETEQIPTRPLLRFHDWIVLSSKGMKRMGDFNEVRELVELECS